MTAAIRITLITALLTAGLALLKLLAGHYGQSHALFADGIHSISDIFIDILVIFAAYYGGKDADVNHPYGHGRIETAATFGLAVILFAAGVGIIWDAGKHLWGGMSAPKPDFYVLWIAIFAIILNEVIYRVTLRIAKNTRSGLLEANAWHSRSDAAVSVVVLLGILGALWGFPVLDVIGAVFVGLMICKMGAGLAIESVAELVDTGVSEEKLNKIRETITAVPGVCTLHLLRTRMFKRNVLVDVHILVSPRISVSEGHYIGDQVMRALYQLPDVSDVTVHVDPEDDEVSHPSSDLPNREAVIALIKSHCAPLPFPQDLRLHYLNGKIECEIVLPHASQHLVEDYVKTLKKIDVIRKMTVVLLPH